MFSHGRIEVTDAVLREEQTQAEKTIVQVDHLLSTGEQSSKYWNSSTECQLRLGQASNGTQKKSECQIRPLFFSTNTR